MSVKSRTIPDTSGALIVEERDGDTDILIRRFRAPLESQPLKVRLEEQLDGPYEDWQRWKNTHAEAVTRALPAAVITALLNRTNTAWTAYVQALNEWRTA